MNWLKMAAPDGTSSVASTSLCPSITTLSGPASLTCSKVAQTKHSWFSRLSEEFCCHWVLADNHLKWLWKSISKQLLFKGSYRKKTYMLWLNLNFYHKTSNLEQIYPFSFTLSFTSHSAHKTQVDSQYSFTIYAMIPAFVPTFFIMNWAILKSTSPRTVSWQAPFWI